MLIAPQPVQAQTPLSRTTIPGGTITTNTTWTLADSPYDVLGSITVANGATLTVEAGVELYWNNSNHFLQVNSGGALIAEGTAAQPILFTSDNTAPGSWYGIFTGGSTAVVTLAHCQVGYAGSSVNGALYVASSSWNVSHCRVHHSANDGIRLTGSGLAPTFSNVQVENSAGNAIHQNTVDMTPAYNNLSFNGNGQDAIVSAGGTVSRNITLIPPGSASDQPIVYKFLGSVVVANPYTLTLSPGVELRFNSINHFLQVNSGGRLHAIGTAANPILFTSDNTAPGSWYGIFTGGATAEVTLAHCQVGYAGSSGNGALYIASSAWNVSDCRVHHSQNDGIRLTGAGLAPTLTRVRVENSGSNAIHQNTVDMTPAYNNLSFSGNGQDAIVSAGGTVSRHITLRPPGGAGGQAIPYKFLGNVTVANTQALTLTPGVELRFNTASHNLTLNSGSRLYAVGTAARPVIFTSDGTTPGSWYGLFINGGGQANLAYCRLEKAGSSASGAIYIASSNVSITHCQIRRSATDAIRVSGAQPTLRYLSIENNAFGVRNSTPGTPVDASFNWWGHPSGPAHASNPGGLRQPVSNGVVFNPWFDSPAFNLTDLELVSVSASAAVHLGDDISVTYSGRNLSDHALLREWTDSLYVSSTPELGPNALLLTRVTNSGGLAALAQYTNTVTVPFPGVIPGNYYVIVVVDSRAIIPDLDRDNNIGATAATTAVTIPDLTLGATHNNTINAGRSRYYRINLPPGSDLLLTLDLTAGWQGELYLRRGQIPTRSQVVELHRAKSKYLAELEELNKGGGDGNPDEPDEPDPDDENLIDDQEVTRNDSWDPNDIIGPTGYDPQRWIRRDQNTLAYTIQFENMPEATAPAREVRISHTLNASLDWTTFTFGDVGFGDRTLSVPPGRQTFFARLDLQSEMGFYVDATGDFDLMTGTATWYLAAIDPVTFDLVADPLAGFLPPNLTSPEGEGFVHFTVRARNTAVTGETILAQASIIFDANEPIETPEYLNTLDAERPTSSANTLPAESSTPFTVSWSGHDGAGSGIAFYDVYVAVGGGPFTLWLAETTAVSASFTGEIGRSYGFYSVATDNVGWRQPTPAAAQASTLVTGVTEHRLYLPLVILGFPRFSRHR